jgi:hypothetical protein
VKGRPVGASNKNKRGLMARLQREFPGYHPIVEMARIANDPAQEVGLRAQMHTQVAKYVTPQLKAVEHTGADGAQLEITVNVVPHAD